MDKVKNNIAKSSLLVTNRNKYLAMINNITYGEDEKNGIVIKNKFLHVPLNNESILIFDGLINELNLNLLDIVEGNLGRTRVDLQKNFNIDNRPSILIKDKKIITFEGRQYQRDIILIKWFGSRVWRFNILTHIDANTTFYDELYHQLTEEEILLAKPKKIQIYATNKGESILSLSKMMSVDQKKLEWFKILNGIDREIIESYELEPGSLVKIIK